MMITFSFDAG